MASWTPLLTTYAINTIINVSNWNALTGSSGNLQYLYDQLIPEIYANGYVSTSFLLNQNNVDYTINPDVLTDIRPSGFQTQFPYSSFTGNIKIRRSGLYLTAATTLNTGSWNTPTLTFKRNGDEISQSAANFTPRYPAINESYAPLPINHFAIQLLEDEDEISAVASKTTGGVLNVQYSPGDSSTDASYFSKSPYVSNVFLNNAGVNTIAPIPIFILDPNINLTIDENVNRNFYPSNDKWISALLPSNSTTMYAFFDTVNTLSSSQWQKLHWAKTKNNANRAYVYPYIPSANYDSIATWRWLPNSDSNADYNYLFMMVVVKSFDEANAPGPNPTGVDFEVNLLSLHTIDRANEITGTPISVTAHTNLAKTQTTIWLRVANWKIMIDTFAKNSSFLANGYIFSLEVGVLYNNIIDYSSIKCNTNVSGVKEINLSTLGNRTGYDLNDIKVMTLGGNEFMPISFYPDQLTMQSYYFIGNWQLDDKANAPVLTGSWNTVIQGDGLYYQQQKESLWRIMKSQFNINDRAIYSSSNALVDQGIVFGTYVFNGLERFV
jgi:hypothetical protein